NGTCLVNRGQGTRDQLPGRLDHYPLPGLGVEDLPVRGVVTVLAQEQHLSAYLYRVGLPRRAVALWTSLLGVHRHHAAVSRLDQVEPGADAEVGAGQFERARDLQLALVRQRCRASPGVDAPMAALP